MTENWTLAIDISHWWQVDWSKLPENVRVIFIKATEDDEFVDPAFERHVEGALEAGKIVAPYHFYRTQFFAKGRKPSPVAQAEHFLDVTRQYWPHFLARANDYEKGPHSEVLGDYNPTTGTEINDLYEFHRRLHESDWKVEADLLYTSYGEWGDFKMMTWQNAWQGPKWLADNPFGLKLWLAAWQKSLPEKQFYPRPFKTIWMWQYSAAAMLPGITNENGAPRAVDANWILLPEGVVDDLLRTEPGESPEVPVDIPTETPTGSTDVLDVLNDLKAQIVEISTQTTQIRGIVEQLGERVERLEKAGGQPGSPAPVEPDPIGPDPEPVEAASRWKFVRKGGSQQTKFFWARKKNNEKIGLEEMGVNWKITHGNIVEEIPVPAEWEFGVNLAPAKTPADLKYVKFKGRPGLIVRGLNDGKFVNLDSGEEW